MYHVHFFGSSVYSVFTLSQIKLSPSLESNKKIKHRRFYAINIAGRTMITRCKLNQIPAQIGLYNFCQPLYVLCILMFDYDKLISFHPNSGYRSKRLFNHLYPNINLHTKLFRDEYLTQDLTTN